MGKKKSIFFELQYQKDHKIRHNLNVMYIEKNVCNNTVYTLLDDPSRSKDNANVRWDLVKLDIREELVPQVAANGKVSLPPAIHTLTKNEKLTFCRVLKHLKVPDGYASNISDSVKLAQCKLQGLKSHDCHILLHQMLPLAIRRVLPAKVVVPLAQLSNYFKAVCSTTSTVADFERLDGEISLILCQLETIFSSAFFIIMVHLQTNTR